MKLKECRLDLNDLNVLNYEDIRATDELPKRRYPWMRTTGPTKGFHSLNNDLRKSHIYQLDSYQHSGGIVLLVYGTKAR